MSTRTVALRDADSGKSQGRLELSSGRLFDEAGNTIGQLAPNGEHDLQLSDFAARCCYANIARQVGHPVRMRDAEGDGQLVTMDIGPNDVHTDAAMPNYAGGYRLADGVADIAMPVVPVIKNSNKYNTWDDVNAFRRVIPNGGAAGAQPFEISPTKSLDSYSCVEYALASYVSTETEANQDAPLNVKRAAVRRVMNALILERELRVATLMVNSASWASGVVSTLGATAKWNGGSTSDPVADLHAIIEASAMPVTRIIMSERVGHWFVRNSNVQKYITYKDSAAPLPKLAQVSSLLQLPPIVEAKMKYYASGTTFSYVWGNDVVLIHEPPSNPPTDQEDVASAYTFRWNGGNVPDSSGGAGMTTAGWTVREYFAMNRGGRGGSVIVVCHNDAEKMTSTLVGGLIKGAYQ